MDDKMTDGSVLRDRLNKVRKAVHKATEDAWKQACGHTPSLKSLQKENNSFMMGMELFGNTVTIDESNGGVTVVSIMEQTVREKLDQVEHDLDRLQREASIQLSSGGLQERDTVDEDNGSEEEEDNELNQTALSNKIESYKAKIAFLRQASCARSCLEESTTLLNLSKEPDLVAASQKLLQALDEIDGAERILETSKVQNQTEVQVAHRILSSLRHQIRRHRVELVHRTTTVLDVNLELAATYISIKSSEQLNTAYQVLEILGGLAVNQRKPSSTSSALEVSMRNFSTQLYQKVFKPILEASGTKTGNLCQWDVEESSDKRAPMIGVSSASMKKGSVYRIEWSAKHVKTNGGGIPANSQDEEETFASIQSLKKMIELIQKILIFVQSKVLLERDALCKLVGGKLFGKPNAMPSVLHLTELGLQSELLGEDDQGVLMENLVKWVEKHCLQEAIQFEDLHQITFMQQRLVDCVSPACDDLIQRKLIPRDPPPRIITFCEGFEKAYVDFRRCTLLNQARDILCNNDYHNTVVVGVEENPLPLDLKEEAFAVFQLSKCSISDTASKIMALIRTTMDKAVEVPTTIRQESVLSLLRPSFYRTAREMLSLFRAIIPSSHGREIATIPRTAAVLHNDAVFLAHNCLTLGLEYKEKLPPVDEDDARGRLLKQTCIFVDLVPLFRELADTSLGDMMDLQKLQLVEIVGSRIKHFGQALRSRESVQEWSEAETALAAGTYHLRHLAQAWKPILSPSVFLRALGYLVDVLLALYLNQVTSAHQISSVACQFACTLFRKASGDVSRLMGSDAHATRYSTKWAHFQSIGAFLGLNSISQIEQAMSSGEFRAVSGDELSKLIQVTYPDSPQQRVLLNSIASKR